MRIPTIVMMSLLTVAAGCARQRAESPSAAAPARAAERAESVRTIAEFQDAAARTRASFELPRFERTPEEVKSYADRALADADAALAQIGSQDPAQATFASTLVALDNAMHQVVNTINRIYLLKDVSTDAAVREAAEEQVTRMSQWAVGVIYREDLHRAIKGFADLHEAGRRTQLRGEDLKLLSDTMRDYRRAGMTLDKATRDRVEAMRKQLTELETKFSTNIVSSRVPIEFQEAELAGVPELFMSQFRAKAAEMGKPAGAAVVMANVTPQVMAVMQNAEREETRRRLDIARGSIAMEQNTPLLDELVRLRADIARALGYQSWADYQTEPRMARSGDAARSFIEDVARRLDPRFQAELEKMRQMKAADAGDPNARIYSWDWRYYENQIKKRGYDVDAEELRVFFPFEQTLEGMFEVYEGIFGLKFVRLEAPYVWADGVELYATLDASTGEPLGLFYMDNFPREGKYNHFAQFGITDGKLLPSGKYQRPVVALVCNFTPPVDGKPSLLQHQEVETLFHEFGHALHSMLTRAKYVTFAGTNVPRDFVEAPSQMLENWVWDIDVLNGFAADYRDPSKKIDPAFLKRMEAARLATAGTAYRRQATFALGDLRLHGPGDSKDSQAIMNRTAAEVFVAPPEGTNFAASFGHLAGYDAGYYGYMWAEAIAADMATRFERSPERFMSRDVGMDLRRTIYEPGGSVDMNDAVRAFLGRDRSLDPFLEHIGAK